MNYKDIQSIVLYSNKNQYYINECLKKDLKNFFKLLQFYIASYYKYESQTSYILSLIYFISLILI